MFRYLIRRLLYLIPLFFGILIIVSELENEDLYNYKEEFEHSSVVKIIIKGIIGCFFYFAGIFLLMKGVVYAIISVYDEEDNKSLKKPKLMPELVVYSNT